jgi:hypothetical protein
MYLENALDEGTRKVRPPTNVLCPFASLFPLLPPLKAYLKTVTERLDGK